LLVKEVLLLLNAFHINFHAIAFHCANYLTFQSKVSKPF
jgi:hypothetical protein